MGMSKTSARLMVAPRDTASDRGDPIINAQDCVPISTLASRETLSTNIPGMWCYSIKWGTGQEHTINLRFDFQVKCHVPIVSFIYSWQQTWWNVIKTIISVHVNRAILLLFQYVIFLPGKRNYKNWANWHTNQHTNQIRYTTC